MNRGKEQEKIANLHIDDEINTDLSVLYWSLLFASLIFGFFFYAFLGTHSIAAMTLPWLFLVPPAALAYFLVKRILQNRKFGKMPLVLESTPKIGGKLEARIELLNSYIKLSNSTSILTCEAQNVIQFHNEKRIEKTLIWQGKINIARALESNTGVIRLNAIIPSELPVSKEGPNAIKWFVELEAGYRSGELKRRYEIVISELEEAGEASPPPTPTTLQNIEISRLLDSVNFTQFGDSIELTSKRRPRWLLGLVIGLTLLFGGYLLETIKDEVIGIIFFVLGALLSYASLVRIGRHYLVQVRPGQLVIKRYWFNLFEKVRPYSPIDITSIEVVESSSTTNAKGYKTQKYRVSINTEADGNVGLFNNISTKQEAELIQSRINERFSL